MAIIKLLVSQFVMTTFENTNTWIQNFIPPSLLPCCRHPSSLKPTPAQVIWVIWTVPGRLKLSITQEMEMPFTANQAMAHLNSKLFMKAAQIYCWWILSRVRMKLVFWWRESTRSTINTSTITSDQATLWIAKSPSQLVGNVCWIDDVCLSSCKWLDSKNLLWYFFDVIYYNLTVLNNWPDSGVSHCD